jgi:hypothetical protein
LVAFPINNGMYEVFSHEGAELGKLATSEVNMAICMAKRHGIEVGKLQEKMGVAFTFGWQGWWPRAPGTSKFDPARQMELQWN